MIDIKERIEKNKHEKETGTNQYLQRTKLRMSKCHLGLHVGYIKCHSSASLSTCVCHSLPAAS